MKILASCALLAAVVAAPSLANAAHRNSAVGPIDSSCVLDVPSGAKVDGATGRVTVDGKVVQEASTCEVPWKATVPPVGDAVGGGLAEGWVMRATASAISHDGLSRFDDIEAYLTVPNAPGDASNAGVQFLWCGLENLTSTGDWISVIQPELVWGDNRQEWVIQTQAVPNSTYLPGVKMAQTGQEVVNPGDKIFCQVLQIGSSEWRINVQDETTGAFSWQDYTPPAGTYGSSPYNWAQFAVYEVQGLTNCNGMPTVDHSLISASKLQQAGTSWNSEYNVLGDVTVGVAAGSSCGYGVAYDYLNQTTSFGWSQ